jgi:hypothetical protein
MDAEAPHRLPSARRQLSFGYCVQCDEVKNARAWPGGNLRQLAVEF